MYDEHIQMINDWFEKHEDYGRWSGMTEEEFMTHIITEICDYAVENDMEPDDTLSTIADNIKVLLTISTFNHWKKQSKKDRR